MHTKGLLLAVPLLLLGCGGGGGGGGGTASATSNTCTSPTNTDTSNVLAVTVDTGPAGVTPNINLPFVTVTICAPGSTTNCQTIDHVLLDTASYGLRVMAPALCSSLLNLPQQTGDSGNALAECSLFLSGYSWGSVRIADVTLAGETARSVPIHIIADPAFGTTPTACSSRGSTPINTVARLGAKGVLGVGPFIQDCGTGCTSAGAVRNWYFQCPSGSSCSADTVALAKQVTNPVALLPTNNNGVVVTMQTIPPTGAATAIGTMALGIGTQSNNGLGTAQVFDVDGNGDLKTTYNLRVLTGFLDTGSNGLFFDDTTIHTCTTSADFFCPPGTLSLSAVVAGATNGTSTTVSFSIANAESLFAGAPGYTAFNNVGGPLSNYFDWGLPFHYGRKVFVGLEPPAGTGPYVAF